MQKGIQLALITAVISGFSIFISQIFVSKMDPVVFTTLKNILVAVVLSILVFSRKTVKRNFSKLSRNDWYKLFAIGIIGGSIPFALFFTGLATVTAPGAAIIHKTLFIWIAFFAIFFLKEKLTVLQMIGYVLILWGALWISGANRLLIWGRGEYMILGATILWAIENVIAKRTLTNVSSEVVSWARMTIGSVILLGIVVTTGKTQTLMNLSGTQIQSTVVGAVLLTGYVLSWYKALTYAPATLVSVVLSLSTIITAVLTSMFISHTYPQGELISALLITSGVICALIVLRKPQTASSNASV